MQILVLKVLLKYSATSADQGTGTCSLHYERSLSFEGFGGGMLLHRLDHEGICVSTGSACNSKDTQISHVLKAMNLDEDWAKGTIRISLGRYNTEEDVKAIAEATICIVR